MNMDILLPISICVILPVAIVLIKALAKVNADNRRSQVLIKAIEADNSIDADRLAEAMRAPQKSAQEVLYGRLLRGCIFTFIGVALLLAAICASASGIPFEDDPVCVPTVFGGMSLAVGAAYLVVFFVSRRQISDQPK